MEISPWTGNSHKCVLKVKHHANNLKRRATQSSASLSQPRKVHSVREDRRKDLSFRSGDRIVHSICFEVEDYAVLPRAVLFLFTH